MSPVNSLWFKWKSFKLPWRTSFLIGSDLQGNTYWEFKDAINANRMRRIVKVDPSTHYADVKVTPQWSQWLRHVRQSPPTIEELQNDLIRQDRLKQLARIADDKWNAKKQYIGPGRESSPLNIETAHDKGPVMAKLNEAQADRQPQKKDIVRNPWAESDRRARDPDQSQPEPWTPPTFKK